MPFTHRVFSDAKLGSSPDEFEDAFWPDGDGADVRGACFAVADGATESSYSRHWAELLVRAYGAGAFRPRDLVRRLPDLQAAWSNEHRRADLPWFASQKLDLGAFAALLGARFTQAPSGYRLHAIAAGDCCLVIVRAEAMLTAWPVGHSADFGNSPALLSSVAPADGQRALVQRLAGRHGVDVTPDDTIVLMTDAIAAWFLREVEAGGAPWRTIRRFRAGVDDGFRAWARDLRSSGRMRNDDVTVALVDIE